MIWYHWATFHQHLFFLLSSRGAWTRARSNRVEQRASKKAKNEEICMHSTLQGKVPSLFLHKERTNEQRKGKEMKEKKTR